MTAEAMGATGATTGRPGWPSGWRVVGRIVLVGWAVLLVAACVTGERASSFAELEGAVASGDVHVVRVTEGLPAGGRGYAVVDVHWRDGWFGDYTRVIEARPVSDAPRWSSDDATAVVGDLRSRLTAAQPGLVIERVDRQGSEVTFHGFRLPDWTVVVYTILGLATLFLLIAGPQPQRATRWAWFWLITMATAVGVPAYLLLAGPATHRFPPRNPSRRLTGGWAFLLALVLGAVLDGR